ncbi:MAG TPA: hypothetical protein VMF07_06295 [Solirubrobacteraceae bacterium]|nr:hypothetical protein [Solirubrobacteraceae bacterium]
MRLRHQLLATVVVAVAAAIAAPAAMASATASMSLDQSAGTSAGGSHNLGLNLSFSDSGSDSPKDLTINLPPGLLANAAIDNGACLTTTPSSNPPSACEVGSGTVTAQPDVSLLGIGVPAPIPISVSFYLVKPPAAGDLAGLEVTGLGQQIGSTGDVLVRPSGSSDGVGATIKLTLPDSLPAASLPAPISTLVNGLVGISITKIASTFDSLRYPTTCPSTPADLTATVDSYDVSTLQNLSQPLSVTGCGSLAYNPSFSVSAKKDSADKGVALTTNVTETAAMAPSQSVALSFPTAVLGPNLASLANFCATYSSSCPQVGSVTAQSSLYPTALTGKAYFTGSPAGPMLTLVFPAPFPLTLTGAINLLTNSATFSGLPDIPLTSLAVTLNGGSKALFDTDCATPSGTATAKLVDQNGDQTRNVSAHFGVVGCPGVSSGGGGGSGSNPGSTTNGSSASSAGSTATASGTQLSGREVSGLASGKPSLTFRVSAAKKRPKIRRMTVTLPAGLSFRSHRAHHRRLVWGVTVKGAKLRSAVLSGGRLVLTLRKTARHATVTLGPKSLRETKALRAKARANKLKRLRLHVAVLNAREQTRSLTVTITKSHLS